MKIEKKHYDDLYAIDKEIAELDARIEKDNIRLRKLRQDRQHAYENLKHNRKP